MSISSPGGGLFFERIHLSLTNILALQKGGKEIEEGLHVLLMLIQQGPSCGVPSQEIRAARSAAVVALRVIVDAAVRGGTFSRQKDHFSRLLAALFETDSCEMDCSLRWPTHLRPLLAYLVSDISSDNNSSVDLSLRALHSFLSFVSNNPIYLSELYSQPSLPLYAKIISVCLEVLANSDRNTETRLLSLSSLRLLSLPSSTLSLSVVLPGLVSQLAAVATRDSAQSVNIICQSVEILFHAITVCLSDDSLTSPTLPAPSPRDPAWISSTSSHLVPLLSSLSAQLVLHRHAPLRLSLFLSLSRLYSLCRSSFSASLDATVFDTALLLKIDPDPRVASAVADFLTTVRTPSAAPPSLSACTLSFPSIPSPSVSFSLHLHSSLTLVSQKLPLVVRRSADPLPLMRQLRSLISCLGSDCLRLSISHAPSLLSTLRSLASSIRIDIPRTSIARTETTKTVEDILLSLPLQFGMDMHEVMKVAEQLAEHGQVEVLDVLLSLLSDSCPSDVPSLLIISSLVVCRLPPSTVSRSPDLIFSLAELSISLLSTLPAQSIPRDDVIRDESSDPSAPSLLGVSLVSCLSLCLSTLSPEQRPQKLLITVLYQLLQLCSHGDWILSQAANVALDEMAKKSGLSLPCYLLPLSPYIVSRVSLACLSPSLHLQATTVLSTLIDRVDDPSMFRHVRHIVTSLLDALDRYNQEHCLGILRALRSFILAMGRWFPDLRPSEKEKTVPETADSSETDAPESAEGAWPEEEEQKEQFPDTVQSVETILHRTKHLLGTDGFPLRLITLTTLQHGLHFVRFFPNCLLPLVHQNWISLRHRFTDDRLEVRIAAVKVLREMSLVSGSFIYRRVIAEAWPAISDWLKKEAGKRVSHAHSAAFKYQVEILESLPDIFLSISLSPSDFHSLVLPYLSLYLLPSTHSRLHHLAQQADSRLRESLHLAPSTPQTETPA